MFVENGQSLYEKKTWRLKSVNWK